MNKDIDKKLIKEVEERAGVDIEKLDSGLYVTSLSTDNPDVCVSVFFNRIFKNGNDENYLLSLAMNELHILDFDFGLCDEKKGT